MFAHLNPHSSDFGDICAFSSPCLHQLTMQSSLFEPVQLWSCPSYSRRRDCINLGLLCSFYKGWGTQFYPPPPPSSPCAGILAIRHPITNGVVTNWDDIQLLWQHAFDNELRIPSDSATVLLADDPFNTLSNREEMVQLLFETFRVGGVYVCNTGALSIYAAGATSGPLPSFQTPELAQVQPRPLPLLSDERVTGGRADGQGDQHNNPPPPTRKLTSFATAPALAAGNGRKT